jgi:tetratricopeptide (TPR) repeat protein
MNTTQTQQFDARGVPVSSCSAVSLDDFETALYPFQSYFGDPTETLATTFQNDPDFVIGHIFNANAMLFMSERQYLPMIQDSIEKAESLSSKSNDREKMLVQATRLWMEGYWDKATYTWDRVLAEYPRDALALQSAHLTDFFLGDEINLRDRVARVLGHWDKDTPSYSYILGMQAFGLEECNQFEQAEEFASSALAMEPRDGWSIHAMAHVLEMQSRYEEGAKFMESRKNDWSVDNGFAYHNWWHLALYYIEQEDFKTAINLYDNQILPGESDVSLQMLDASSLLWRLHLLGVDVGDRWNPISELWSRKAPVENDYYAFNDMHAVVSYLGAGKFSDAHEMLKEVEKAGELNPGISRMMARDVGVPVCAGMISFAEGKYDEAVN